MILERIKGNREVDIYARQKNTPLYSLFKKQTKSGFFWYVRFWDGETKTYRIVRSTGIPVEGKRKRRREADDMAKAILEELKKVPQSLSSRAGTVKDNLDPLKAVSPLVDAIPATPLSKPNSSKPVNTAQTPFTQYLLNFWTPEGDYAQYKSGVKKRPLSAYYIAMNHDDVE